MSDANLEKNEISKDSKSGASIITNIVIDETKVTRTLQQRNSKLDITKVERINLNENKPNQQNSFRDVVKTTMLLRSWMTSNHGPDERRSDAFASEIFEPQAATSVAVEIEEEVERLSGFQFVKEMFIRGIMKVRYFYVDPNGPFYYYWSTLVALGIVYNAIAIVIFIFEDVYFKFYYIWLLLNFIFDIVYFIDSILMTRKIYIYEGMEVRNHGKTFLNYLHDPCPIIGNIHLGSLEIGGRLLFDILSLVPLDLFLILNPHISLLRLGRLFKAHRIADFYEKALKRTSFPHGAQIFFLIFACYIIFHWNACVYFLFSLAEGLSEEDPGAFGFSYYKVFDPKLPLCDVNEPGCLMDEVPKTDKLDDERPHYTEKLYEFWKNKSYTLLMGNFSREYSMSMYWSALTITTCGQQPYPSNSGQNMLEVADTMIGVLVFATIIGSVGSVVTEMNQSVYDFRQKMDAIKFYMKYRAVNINIQERVLSCFMYMNQQNQLTDEAELLEVLPPRLQGQLAVNLHMETIKGVSLFRNCEAGFLYEIVMKIKQQIFNPNDYLCRTGEKAKEMYIVKRGTLNVIDDSSKNVIDTLTDGATFGEMSMIRLKGCNYGEYRDCSLRSEGYSDVYILNQDDVAAVLQDYPTAREVIIKNASEWLESQNLLRENTGEIDETFNILSVDEQLLRLKNQIEQIDDQLNNMYTSFNELSSEMKKRVTNLEVTSQSHKKRIKRDIAGIR